ncbi:MAG: methyltransferase family protein [Candidatus Dormibacteria bacterium]
MPARPGPSPIFRQSAPAWGFWAMVAAWIASEIGLQLRHGGRSRERAAVSQDQGSMTRLVISVWAAVLVGLAASRFLPRFRLPGSGPGAVWSGLTLMAAGMVLRAWAARTLGRWFTVRVTTLPDQLLLQRGPYRYLQHPGYTGALLTLLGCLVACANLLGWLMLAPAVSAYLRRMRIEDLALRQRFGAEHEAYQARRWRLLPFIH